MDFDPRLCLFRACVSCLASLACHRRIESQKVARAAKLQRDTRVVDEKYRRSYAKVN